LDQYPNKVISYLYAINKNIPFTNHKNNKVPNNLVSAINTIVSEINMKPENSLFALGNLHFLLSDEQTMNIQDKLKNTDYSLIKSERVWHIFLFFANGDRSIRDKINYRKVPFGLLE
jgi:hypothetical protein